MSNVVLCKYCNMEETLNKPCLTCSVCERNIHISCLKTATGVPSSLLGDVFFSLICENCSDTRREVIMREKMSWLALVVMVLHNLHQQSQTSSRRGYFHWKMHICKFVQDKWKVLFRPTVKRKKTWMGTVSGTLTHAPGIFQSGLEDLGEAGWWRLYFPDFSPKQTLLNKANKKSTKKKNLLELHSELILKNEEDNSLYSGNESMTGSEKLSGVKQEIAWSVSSDSSEMYSRAYVEPSATLSDMLFDQQDEEDIDVDLVIDGSVPGISHQADPLLIPDAVQLLHSTQSSLSEEYTQTWTIKSEKSWSQKQDWLASSLSQPPAASSMINQETRLDRPTVVVKQEKRTEFQTDFIKQEKRTWNEDAENDDSEEIAPIKKQCQPMSQFEEVQLMHRLQRAGPLPDAATRRLLRKLVVRHAKRQNNLPLFNVDLSPTGYTDSDPSLSRLLNSSFERVLDRFQITGQFSGSRKSNQQTTSFLLRLLGHTVLTCFYSPYTERLLKPYIMREPSEKVPWVQLMSELLARVHKDTPDWKPPTPGTLDYSYVRPHHIAPINSLCRQFFWPGIDDFSCVALYKKLVVGFGFLVPNISYNESYITFLFVRPEWRHAGIASFILYHLIQTCMGKDVTLHVSATNPALILYQKFGFKVEEFVQDFYEKYFEVDSQECRHALFLRLSR
ncbi:hypothetical protein B566_EDAN006702 [Ephemera danica]|nr:hypothetical protein B566_EDAN006702 [Ephemera danica]